MSNRIAKYRQLLAPAAVWAILVAAAFVAARTVQSTRSWFILTLEILLLAVVLLVAARMLIRRRDQQIAQALTGLARGGGASLDPAASIEEALDQFDTALTDKRAKLEAETERRLAIEKTLQDTEQRYVMAIQGANDGLWEWDLTADAIYVSPRWLSMLGLSAAEAPNSVQAWRERLHPEDRARVEAELAAHCAGSSDRFASEHRLLRGDGSVCWVHARATALRHASGRPYRVVGLDTDITHIKRVENILRHVAEGTSGTSGSEFFRSLVKHFALATQVRQVFVTECVDLPPTRVRALACWDRGQFINEEYDLAPTPCKRVIEEGKPYFIPTDLAKLFPNELAYGFKSYLGVPIFDGHQRVVGHLVFKDEAPMDDRMLMDAVYRIFTTRAGVEMQRVQEQKALLEIASQMSGLDLRGSERVLVKNFATLMNAREAFLTEHVDYPVTRVRAIVYWNAGTIATDVEYDLAGNPCELVYGQGEVLYVPKDVAERWPLEKQYGRASYLGIPCSDESGRTIGHLACFDDQPMRAEPPDPTLINFFRERATQVVRQRQTPK